MAKKPSDEFEYYFQLISPTHVRINKHNVAKGENASTYNAIVAPGSVRCDCPASYSPKRGACKHCEWVRRYMRLLEQRPELRQRVVYYNPVTDDFRSPTNTEG